MLHRYRRKRNGTGVSILQKNLPFSNPLPLNKLQQDILPPQGNFWVSLERVSSRCHGNYAVQALPLRAKVLAMNWPHLPGLLVEFNFFWNMGQELTPEMLVISAVVQTVRTVDISTAETEVWLKRHWRHTTCKWHASDMQVMTEIACDLNSGRD